MTDFLRPSPQDACPCGRQQGSRALAYGDCCGRYVEHFDTAPAPDAQALMRSRYTAFVLGRAPYLLATWHPASRPSSLELDAGIKWLGLDVKRAQTTGEGQAEVEFVARYRDMGGSGSGRAVRLHEHSRFTQEMGRWFYLDGDDLTA